MDSVNVSKSELSAILEFIGDGGGAYDVLRVDGERKRLSATDGKTLAEIEYPEMVSRSGNISPEKIETAIKTLPRDGCASLNGTLDFPSGIKIEIEDGGYPEFARIYPTEEPLGDIVLSAAYIARVAKAATAIHGKYATVKLTFRDRKTAIHFETGLRDCTPSTRMVGLVMPIVVND